MTRRRERETDLQNKQLDLGDVVAMHPVLGGLAYKVLLAPTGGTVSLDGVSFGPDEVIEARQLHHKGIVVVLEEGFGVETGGKDGFEKPPGLFLSIPLC